MNSGRVTVRGWTGGRRDDFGGMHANSGSGRRIRQETVDRGFQSWQILLDDTPDNLKIDAEVVVDHLIAQAGNLLPRNRRLARLTVVRETLHCLADHLELAQRRVLPHAIGEK